MGTTLLLRPEMEHQQYRLTCRLTLDAPLRGVKTRRWLDYAEHELRRVYRQFVADMEKQGWSHVPGALALKGPFSHIDPRGIPSKPTKPRRQKGQPSVPIERWDKTDWSYYTEAVVGVEQHEQWDYEFSESFTRRMRVEVPDVGQRSEMSVSEYLKEAKSA